MLVRIQQPYFSSKILLPVHLLGYKKDLLKKLSQHRATQDEPVKEF